jgi:hypothetical protein
VVAILAIMGEKEKTPKTKRQEEDEDGRGKLPSIINLRPNECPII